MKHFRILLTLTALLFTAASPAMAENAAKTFKERVDQKNVSSPTKPFQSAPAKKIEWITDLYTAYQKAVEKKKVMVVYFTGKWCKWCDKLDQDILPKPEFNALADKAVFAKIDADIDDANKNVSGMIKSLGIEKYPTVVALDASETDIVERGRVVGYHDLNEYLRQFKKILP